VESSRRAAFYRELLAALPDERFVFMNHGYLEAGDDVTALGVDAVSAWSANLVRRMVRGIDLRGKLVADVGCGRGGASAWLLSHGGCRRVVGLDLEPGNVAFCRRVHRNERLSFARGDAQALPLADGCLDVVFNLESSHCYADRAGFFGEVARVLSRDGIFCYADALDGPGATAIAERTAQLVACGFTVVEKADVTSPVAAALFAGFEEQARFFFAAMTRDPGRKDALLRMLKGVTFAPFVGYATGRLSYGLWRLERSAQPRR
jgi:O-methyltransferase